MVSPRVSKIISTMTSQPETWTLTHDIGLLYLAVSHGTDRELLDSELVVMKREIQRWKPSITGEACQEMIMECLSIYLSDRRDEILKRAIVRIRKDADVSQKLAVIMDMVDLAEADGVVLFTEKQLIKTLSKIWEVDIEANSVLKQFIEEN